MAHGKNCRPFHNDQVCETFWCDNPPEVRSGASVMRIVENSPSRLVLRDRTYWVTIVCFAAALFGAGYFALHRGDPRELIPTALFVAFGLAFLRATDVVFDRIDRRCVVRRLDVVKVTRTELLFHDLTDIRVDVSALGESGGVSCRLALVTASGTVPLTASFEPDLARYTAMREVIVGVIFPSGHLPPPSDPARDLARAGRLVEAVAVLRQRDKLTLTDAMDRAKAMRDAPDNK